MLKKTRLEDLSPDLVALHQEMDLIVRSYLGALSFIVQNSARDPSFVNTNLLSYVSHALLQSTLSITTLSIEGMLSVAKRELRFLLEASIKTCYVQQNDFRSGNTDKLKAFDKELSSQRISVKNNIDLKLLSIDLRQPFNEEVGRLYGLTSGYVHLTPKQIIELIETVNIGAIGGKERPEDIVSLNDVSRRTMAASLVLLFHSVPEYVVGDWFEDTFTPSFDWFFNQSRFVAEIDRYFDYKHERQEMLNVIRKRRKAKICF